MSSSGIPLPAESPSRATTKYESQGSLVGRSGKCLFLPALITIRFELPGSGVIILPNAFLGTSISVSRNLSSSGSPRSSRLVNQPIVPPTTRSTPSGRAWFPRSSAEGSRTRPPRRDAEGNADGADRHRDGPGSVSPAARPQAAPPRRSTHSRRPGPDASPGRPRLDALTRSRDDPDRHLCASRVNRVEPDLGRLVASTDRPVCRAAPGPGPSSWRSSSTGAQWTVNPPASPEATTRAERPGAAEAEKVVDDAVDLVVRCRRRSCGDPGKPAHDFGFALSNACCSSTETGAPGGVPASQSEKSETERPDRSAERCRECQC